MTLTACNTVNKKIDSKVDQEEKMLNEWLNQSETELKMLGQDLVQMIILQIL